MSESWQVKLPPELLLAIFSLLPGKDILTCKRLSHSTHDLICASAEIQYKIELYGAYQREMDTTGRGSEEPVVAHLQTLRSVTSGWAALRFARHSVLGYPLSSSYVYEVSGGRLVLGSDLNRIATRLNGTSVLSVHVLPSRFSSDVDEIRRRDIRLASPIADFAMDVHQNLLVLVERRLDHNIKLLLRTFDTNVPHPDASRPILEYGKASWVTIHISGSILACLFVDVVINSIDVVVVWDWKTGHRLGQTSGPNRKSFVLISPSSLAIANLATETLDIYDINNEAKTLTLFHRLKLPQANWQVNSRQWTYEEALLRSHPTPLPENGSSVMSSMLEPHAELPFTTDEADGIVSCNFYCHSIGTSFTLIVHRSALRRRYISTVGTHEVPGSLTEQQEPLVPWFQWGPENTRWVNAEPSQRWICYVHGHKLAVLEAKPNQGPGEGRSSAALYDSDDDDEETQQRRLALIQTHLAHIRIGGSSSDYSHMSPADQALFVSDEENAGYHYLRVFDFNPRGVRRASIEEKLPVAKPDTTGKKRAVQGQMLVKDPSILQGTIETNLPYLETTVRLRDIGLAGKRRQIEGVMMNAESVMIMMSHSSRFDGVEVLTV